jgi:flagellar basal body-associated protein FliL
VQEDNPVSQPASPNQEPVPSNEPQQALPQQPAAQGPQLFGPQQQDPVENIPQPFAQQPQIPQQERFSSSQQPASGGGAQPSKKKLIIIIIGVILACGIAFGAMALMGVFSTTTKSNVQSLDGSAALTTPASEKKAYTATASRDFNSVCSGGKISNAPAYASPHGVLSFVPSSDKWTLNFYDNMPADMTKADIVLCTSVDEATAGEAVTCDLQDISTGNDIKKTFTDATYEYAAYKAQTGELIKNGTMKAECPTYYGGVDEKYLSYSQSEFDSIVSELIK